MNMSNGKKSICYGLILNGIVFLIKQQDIFYIILSDFIRGFLEGFSRSLAMILILFGLYCEIPNLQKIKGYKIKVFNKISRK